MYIKTIKLVIQTNQGQFGFSVPFSRNLTVIRGKNSSGKSTLLNCLLYALGMEEIIGGKGEKMLPYAARDYVEFQGHKIPIDNSEVYLEIENKRQKLLTIRRVIKSPIKSSKLVEVSQGASISEGADFVVIKSLYLHDPGSAKIEEGFYKFLENFLEYDLPIVPTSSGGAAKLYLQTIFAAVAVEQKRGWSDYIAGIPFYGIREARLRVVEYLLNLNVFESNTLRNTLDADSVEIANEWNSVLKDILRLSNDTGTFVSELPQKPINNFEEELVTLEKLDGSQRLVLPHYIEQLRQEYNSLEEKVLNFNKATSEEVRQDFDDSMQETQRLSTVYESISARQSLNKSSLNDYLLLLAEAREDIVKNKAALKLKELGAQNALATAIDICPTCQQSVQDSLMSEVITGPQMDLETNINYLQRQSAMLESQINGVRREIELDESAKSELSRRIASKKEHLNAIRQDFSSGASQSRATVKRQLQIEDEINAIENFQIELSQYLGTLKGLSRRLLSNQEQRKSLPKFNYSEIDEKKIDIFEKYFRSNAASFGYESAKIEEIELNKETLTPFLASIELREVTTDIKSDSSASDFVRLIWSYLLGLYQTSVLDFVKGNHPAILIFDEPGQHSMAASSQNALLKQLSGERGLQSIVAASFDENDAVYREVTHGVTFDLIELESKVIQKLTEKS